MQERSRRTWLMLALLSYSVAAALAMGLGSLQSRMAAPAQTAGMQLQGNPDGEVAAAPDADQGEGESDKNAVCVLRDCPAPKQEAALARINQEPVFARTDAPQESKVFIAPGDDVQPKSKD